MNESMVHDPDYQAGYADMMRLHAEAMRRGWPVPPERWLVAEILWLERSAAIHQAAPAALPVLNQPLYPPGWYRGRAAAIRQLLREMRTYGD